MGASRPETPDEQVNDAAVYQDWRDVERQWQVQNQSVQGIMPPGEIIGQLIEQDVDDAQNQSTQQGG